MTVIEKFSDLREKSKPFLDLLPIKEKKTFWLIICLQIFIASFDIVAIFLVGIVSILVTNYVVASDFDSPVMEIIQIIGLEKFSEKTLIFIFSVLVIVFFVFKTFISISINKKILFFYARKEVEFSVLLYSRLLNSPYSWLKRQNSERIHSALITGSNAIFMRVIANVTLIVSDVFLLLFIFLFLLILSPVISVFAFIFFACFVLVLHRAVAKKASHYGNVYSESLSESYTYLSALMLSFREIFIMNKGQYFTGKYKTAENLKVISSAQGLWIQLLPKYVFEIALALGIFVLSGYLLAGDISNISLLTIFIVASGRIIPALFRIQSCMFNLLLGYPNALIAINFAKETQENSPKIQSIVEYYLTSPPSISIQDVSFKFPDSAQNVIDNISLELGSGESMAFVGKSGSGKTTLVDLILDIYSPSKGNILINDGAREITPGKISNLAYISQNPIILKGTILENIAFGNDAKDVDLATLDYAINAVNLKELLVKLPDGLNTELNNLGGILSGGEKQRIAIARALYLKPKLMVIDEGTSSLDLTSENFITNFLATLKGQVTIIIVAHRINTVKNVDKIYFIESGKIKGSGSYESLKKSVPEFESWSEPMKSESDPLVNM